jgi:hypothetical protein
MFFEKFDKFADAPNAVSAKKERQLDGLNKKNLGGLHG